MNQFSHVEEQLLKLERRHFERLRASFCWTPKNELYASGAAQFFALDSAQRTSGELPVVCAVGINYTQEKRRNVDGLVHFSGATPPVITTNTGTRRQPAFVIAAYNRNKDIWTKAAPSDPTSPLGAYGAPDAVRHPSLQGASPEEIGPYILVMTNLSPLITQLPWQDQVRRTPQAHSDLVQGEFNHLDDLFEALGDSIDLWLGHSAINGTRWVWPQFAAFARRHGIQNWLLCGNLSPMAHLWHNGAFRKPSHRLYPWFK